MVSPAAQVLTAEPDRPATPARGRSGLLVLVLGAVTTLAALAFPFAPVVQPQVTYSWSAADGPAAIALMPYQPVELAATTTCDAARAAGPGTLLLSTVPPRPDPAARPLLGLRLTAVPDGLALSSAGVDLGVAPLPAGPCTVTLASDPRATRLLVDGNPVLDRAGDVRPDVAGAFSSARGGVGLRLVADTRFQTTITPLKAGIAVVGVLALLALLVALAGADRAHGRAVRLLPRLRPRLVDLAVIAVLGVWWVVGAVTVDDGYIAGIIRSRGENGFIGNVYRWLNAPESPFSWFYDPMYAWSQVSTSTLWMRLPSVLLGLLCWVLLSRGLLPRLGRRISPWIGALGLLTWWVPFNLGLRPEPWVAAGLAGTTLAVERAIATRRVLPLVGGLLLAGVTTALTPGGLVAFVPYLAALGPLLRLVHTRRDLSGWPLVAAAVAAPAASMFLMLDDQSLGAMLESVRVRNVVGGGLPWYGEYERYANLFAPTDIQGSIGRRAAVLATLVALAGLLWAARRVRGTGVATGPATRLGVGFLLSLAVMTFTPTKWTQHFGDLAVTGAAVIAVAAAGCASPALRRRPAAFAGSLAAVTAAGALVLAANNVWPFVSGWYNPAYSTIAMHLGPVTLTGLLLVVGGVGVAVFVLVRAWRRAGGQQAPGVPTRAPGPVAVLLSVLALVLALQVASLTRVALTHPDGYTLASDAVATLQGDPCGLQRDLSVETDPAAGLLSPRTPTDTGRTVDAGGTPLPGVAVSGRVTTAWYALDPAQRDGTLPVVVTTAGSARPGDAVTLQFGAGEAIAGESVIGAGAVPVSDGRDVRVLAPRGAGDVRIVVDAGPGGTGAVSVPRVPRLTPMETLMPRGTEAILDWPVAFVLPCLTPQPLPLGTTGLPVWRVGPPQSDPAAGITYHPAFGGPFAAPRMLVTERRMPAYLSGDPLRDPVQVYRWTPVEPLSTLRPAVTLREVPGWASDGHARVSELDPVG